MALKQSCYLQHHGLQHTRLSCPSPTARACSNSCPSSRWSYRTISSSVIPFSFCLQYFPASGSFPVLHIKWPKYWSFSFRNSLSNEYSGLISYRTDWFDLLAVQGTLKSLSQHHSSKASFLQHSAFSLSNSHLYMTTHSLPHFKSPLPSFSPPPYQSNKATLTKAPRDHVAQSVVVGFLVLILLDHSNIEYSWSLPLPGNIV